MQFFVDQNKILPSLYNFAVVHLAPHITTEDGLNAIFSQAGHLSNPTCSRTKIKTFEWLIISKHRMHNIYCCPDKERELYLHRIKDKTWDEELERDDRSFLES